jgi:hypothetical protein
MKPFNWLCRVSLAIALLALSGCGGDQGDKSPTSSRGPSKSDLDTDWSNGETGHTWSFDSDGRFWFFESILGSEGDFMGTWELQGDRITLTVEGRGQLLLKVSLSGRTLTVTRLCDESASFFTAAELAECRASPTTTYERAGL